MMRAQYDALLSRLDEGEAAALEIEPNSPAAFVDRKPVR
jgi:hypothetical protein